METKRDIRKRVLSKRAAISINDWEKNSHFIYEKVVAHPLFLNADEIYCYMDFRNEVGTKEILEQSWYLRKKVAVPKILGNEMQFYYINSVNELQEGYFGVLEPITKKIAEGKNVLVIMPGTVFDYQRHRIGYGKGFYDKYLDKHPDYQTMALAFELQMTENIIADAHDVCPNIIITEEHIYA